MLNFIYMLFALFIICILSYYGVIKLIKLWSGCNDNEAVSRLHQFLNGSRCYKFEEELGISNDIWENVKKIIGEKRFEQLIALNSTFINPPLLFWGFEGGLPFIGVSLYYIDENEKQILENIIVNIIKKYLQIYGYYTAVLVAWKERYDLNMPYLQVRYARNEEDRRILELGIFNEQQYIVKQNSELKDDTENVDLD